MRRKDEIISFKVDQALREALDSIPNRSDFIRSAVMKALRNVCPLCNGVGALTPNQMRHWQAIAAAHPLRKCMDCDEYHLVCSHGDEPAISELDQE